MLSNSGDLEMNWRGLMKPVLFVGVDLDVSLISELID